MKYSGVKVAGLLFLLLIINGCKTRQPAGAADKQIVEVIFLQMNDVYEIAPLRGDNKGGLARVATLRQQLLQENPNVYTVVSGDFLNPSLIGTLEYAGERINGQHMIEVLNALGVDLVTFGNHEIDLNFWDLQKRMDEAKFDWVSSNTFINKGDYFEPFNQRDTVIPSERILEFKNEAGKSLKVGIFAVTLPFNKTPYVFYTPVMESAYEVAADLLKRTDIVVGLTHLDIEDDLHLADTLPGVALLMGGHDHHHMKYERAQAVVAKADANARTVYVHRLRYNLKTGDYTLDSELIPVTSELPSEPATAAVVEKWDHIAEKAMAAMGFNPDQDIYGLGLEEWDGREAVIRSEQTNFGNIIAQSLAHAWPGADGAVLNSGSVRLDDMLTGGVTEYDVVRSLPFGGKVLLVKMKGSLLNKVLDAGLANTGKGGYLQWYYIHQSPDATWIVHGYPVEDDKIYGIAMPEFLMTGGESNLDFLTAENPGVVEVVQPVPGTPAFDIRKAVIDFLIHQ